MSVSRTKKAITNITYSLFNQIITVGLVFISRAIFIQVFGIEYLGINSLFADILGVLSMADLGFNTAIVYSFYKPLSEKNYNKLSSLIGFYRQIYIRIAVGITILGISMMPILPYLVKSKISILNLEIYYLFFLINTVVSYLFVYKTAILTADQNNYIITRITTVINIIKTVSQIILILMFKNYYMYLIVDVLFSVMNNFIASREADRLYPFINEKIKIDIKTKKEVLKNALSSFIYKVSSVLLSATDNILISVIISTAAVGYYSNYLVIQNKIALFYSLVFTSLIAGIGNIIAKENFFKRYEIFECEQVISFIICSVVIPCYVCLVNDFILLWLGREFLFPLKVVFSIGFNMYLGCVLQPLWSYRDATGMYQKTKWIMVICAVLNLFLSVILGMIHGIIGIILASAISRIMTYVWYEPRVLFKEYFQKKPYGYYCRVLLNLMLIIGLVVICKYLSLFIEIKSWLDWCIKACLILLICSGVGIILYYRSNGMKILREKLNRIKK